ncbi:MAG: hypothetical protein Q9208_006579 [Pyrenodesmia sp. 3 TL-2023]
MNPTFALSLQTIYILARHHSPPSYLLNSHAFYSVSNTTSVFQHPSTLSTQHEIITPTALTTSTSSPDTIRSVIIALQHTLPTPQPGEQFPQTLYYMVRLNGLTNLLYGPTMYFESCITG